MKKKDNFIITIFILTFVLSILFSSVSNVIAATFNEVVLFIIMILVIVVGIIFDTIGTAALSAKESTFHSMSSAKVKGAKETITLLKNSSHIATLCNDVVGDVCGIVSGGIGAVVAISFATRFSFDTTIINVALSAFISALTVGGKALMKTVAIKKADSIIFTVGKIKHILRMK